MNHNYTTLLNYFVNLERIPSNQKRRTIKKNDKDNCNLDYISFEKHVCTYMVAQLLFQL